MNQANTTNQVKRSSVVIGSPVRVEPERWGEGIWAANRRRDRDAKAKQETISQSRAQQREQAIATAWARGRKLLADGYIVRPTSVAYCWSVARPGERQTPAPEGGTVERYSVAFHREEWVCDCPFCSLHGVCKHVVGVRLYLSACAASLSPAFDFTADVERLGLRNVAPEVKQ